MDKNSQSKYALMIEMKFYPTKHSSTILFLLITAIALTIAFFIVTAPSLPHWSKRHLPHEDPRYLTLSSGHTIEQTFTFDQKELDLIAVWLDSTQPLPEHGSILLKAAGQQTSQIKFSDIPPSNIALFPLRPSLTAPVGSNGSFKLTLSDPGQKVSLKYQIDGNKYADGKVIHSGRDKPNDLAFQLRYQRPALNSQALHCIYALAILVAGLILALTWKIQPPPYRKKILSRQDLFLALLLAAIASLFYGWSLMQPGFWVGASDFSKDAAYLSASANALRSGNWPIWSHITCGGMALLGNPESNTLSLGTLFALFMPSDRALLLLLTIETGLAAAGTFLLARAMNIKLAGSLTATIINVLSAAYAYRILEGQTQAGGPIAFLPWIFLGLVLSSKTANRRWLIMSGTALAAIFLRSDVHIIIGIIVTIVAWYTVLSWQKKSLKPLTALVIIGAVSFLWASIKILPYLEQPDLISTKLHPYVAVLSQQRLLDDVFLKLPPRGSMTPVLHGKMPVHFGNFGAYVGILPLALAALGLFIKNRYRLPLIVSLIVAFILSEGTLFEVFLRHIPPLDILLRVPTRLLGIVIFFLGLLAGIATDRIAHISKPNIRQIIITLLIITLTINLGRATRIVLTRDLEWSAAPTKHMPDKPTLALHKNVSPNHEYHATKLNRAGFLLPHICGDQNNPAPFIQELNQPMTPLSSVPLSLKPNRIILSPPAGPADIIVSERFVSSWTTAGNASVLASSKGAIHIITPKSTPRSIELVYMDPTASAQKTLTILLLLTLIMLGLWIMPLLFYSTPHKKS